MLRRNYFLIFVLVLTGVLFLPHSSHLQSIPPDLPDPPVLDQAALDAASARGVPKNYYVDSIDGDDFNIGTIAWPWKTLQKVYDRSPSFAPGTNIFLKRGCTWNEPLRLQCDGDPTKNPYQYIVIRDYGYGDKPKINGDGNGFDCAVYLDRNFIYLRNLSITYINQGFAQGGTVGKGIRIAPTTRPDLETQENNIWLDQCDVSNCPLDGILIFQRGHITVSGNQNNTPPPFAIERSLITPTLSLLLLSDDPSGDNLQSPMVSEPTEAIFPPPPPDLTTDRPIRHAVKHPLSPVFQHSPQDMSPPPALLASPPPPAEPLDPTLIPPPPPVVLPKYTPGVTDTPGLTASANTVTPLADADILQKSDISFNGTVGITVLSRYEGSFVDCNDITIDYCYIHHNNQHGVYLEGSNAIIKNNLMQYNGNQRDQHGNPTHNCYLWGDNCNVISNEFSYSQPGGNGCGFRYSGSNLRFGMDSNDVPYLNIVKDNYNAGIGLWNNDSIHNCDNNKIANNIFNVKKTDVSGNNMAISIGYDPGTPVFTNTHIYNNIITGDNDSEKKAGGIDIQPCQNLYIHDNTFSGYLISDRLTGPLIQIDRQGRDSNGNPWQWNISDLNVDFSHDNTFYANAPGLGTGNLWFYDERFNDNPGWCSWGHWTSLPAQGGLGRDANYHLMQGQY